VGIVAFLSGLAPFWGIIAGIAAVVFGAIALAKRQSKGLAITGLALGAVAVIASLITTIVLIAGVNAAITNTPSVQAPDADASEGQPSEVETAPLGSRENPAPMGSTVTGADWDVVVNSFTPDATQLVTDGNMFNSPAEPGFHYAAVNYTVTYKGVDSSYAAMVSVALVTSTGEVLTTLDSLAVLADSFSLDELYAGASATGSIAILVPDGADVLIRVTPGLLEDDSFISTQ
jgi:hypothetical protein